MKWIITKRAGHDSREEYMTRDEARAAFVRVSKLVASGELESATLWEVPDNAGAKCLSHAELTGL